ncbi:MAG: MAPEG family protein [Paracoccaceae bacterium]
MPLHLTIAVIAVFVQVALTLWAIYRMGAMRLADLRAFRPDMAELAVGRHRYSDAVAQLERNTHNQFETPQLFYAAVALGAALNASTWGLAFFAVAFAVLRLAHRYVHVGSNRLGHRFTIYVISLLALVGLWVSLAIGMVIA